jgi:LDH2 family malate/lactate/ureidoglycolate dehydrogenase
MAVMLAKTYAAFKAAGVDEDHAQAAAEELAAFKERFSSMGSGISRIDSKITAIEGKMTAIASKITAIEGRFSVLLWAVGINAAATIAILGVLLRHG